MFDIIKEIKSSRSDLGKLPKRCTYWDFLLLDDQPTILALFWLMHRGMELRCIILFIDDLPEIEIAETIAIPMPLCMCRRRVLEQIYQNIPDFFLNLMRVLLQIQL